MGTFEEKVIFMLERMAKAQEKMAYVEAEALDIRRAETEDYAKRSALRDAREAESHEWYKKLAEKQGVA